MKIAVIDYGMGNIGSVQNALKEIGAQSALVQRPEDVKKFDRIILPGVGAFGDAMRILRKHGLDTALTQAVKKGAPLLGVCLGMQLICSTSEEGGSHRGLNWIQAKVVRLKSKPGVKIPHIGWNGIFFQKKSPLIEGIPDKSDFYFVHSYHVVCKNKNDVLATCEHGQTFTAMIAHENIYAAQFHPEKSQREGLKILTNFLKC
ncbi:MAG: imidazole glycerol phosphate synthase subunit HisH [Verrucomicrobiota bacterium]